MGGFKNSNIIVLRMCTPEYTGPISSDDLTLPLNLQGTMPTVGGVRFTEFTCITCKRRRHINSPDVHKCRCGFRICGPCQAAHKATCPKGNG